MLENDFDQETFNEFIIDSMELIENADRVLMNLEDHTITLAEGYKAIFNCLHSLKGSLGMFNLLAEMDYIHQLEDWFKKFEKQDYISEHELRYMAQCLKSVEKRLTDPTFPFYSKEQSFGNSSQACQPHPINQSKIYAQSDNDSHMQILVIDDNTIVLDSFIDYFGNRFKTYAVTNVKDGITVLEENPEIHVVFCDFHMPNQKGTKLLEYMNRSKNELPVIIMSDAADRSNLVELLKKHTFYFVEKQEGFLEIERALRKAQRARMKQLADEARRMLIKKRI